MTHGIEQPWTLYFPERPTCEMPPGKKKKRISLMPISPESRRPATPAILPRYSAMMKHGTSGLAHMFLTLQTSGLL